MEVDLILKKKYRKQNLVRPGGFICDKVVLTLLIEVTIFHIETSTIDVKNLALSLFPDDLPFYA